MVILPHISYSEFASNPIRITIKQYCALKTIPCIWYFILLTYSIVQIICNIEIMEHFPTLDLCVVHKWQYTTPSHNKPSSFSIGPEFAVQILCDVLCMVRWILCVFINSSPQTKEWKIGFLLKVMVLIEYYLLKWDSAKQI